MTTTDDHEARRDRALDDLLDVDRQLAAGEMSERDAEQLRARYRAEALTSIRKLQAPATDRNDADEQPRPAPASGGRRIRSRHLLYTAVISLAVVAAVLVTRNVLDRPPGGYVSGNIPMQGMADTGATTAAPDAPRDLSKVTDAELEAVVDANPRVVGMRLALAQRYTEKNRYDLALVHYAKALELEPDNAEAQAHLGWLNFQVGRTKEAARFVDAAVEADPKNPDALWFQANVRLDGTNDPAGALDALDALAELDGLGPTVRRQVAALRAEASRKLEAR